jgi:hypothetical protein
MRTLFAGFGTGRERFEEARVHIHVAKIGKRMSKDLI